MLRLDSLSELSKDFELRHESTDEINTRSPRSCSGDSFMCLASHVKTGALEGLPNNDRGERGP